MVVQRDKMYIFCFLSFLFFIIFPFAGCGSSVISKQPVSISGICSSDEECNDDNSHTIDKCYNFNTIFSTCVNIKQSRIAAGISHTCAIVSDGTVKCWGLNTSGQLGNGTTTDSVIPIKTIGISTAVAIGAEVFPQGYVTAKGYTCAIVSDGTIKCWGLNTSGQLGNGTTTDSLVPISVIGINNALDIAIGEEHTCAIVSDGTIKCWGYNSYGQLGNDGTTDTSLPVNVTNIINAFAIAAAGNHTCAIVSDGTIKCWGVNMVGQLGNGTMRNDTSTPVMVKDINNAIDIVAGYGHSCALLSNGSVKCWGGNSFGELGNDSTVDSPIPVYVTGVNNALAITAGGQHTCVIVSGRTIKCWGDNSTGELGNGTKINSSLPVSVDNISDAVDITAGGNHICALLSNDTIKCWGANGKGQLGNGTKTSSSTPINVTNFP